MTSTSADTGRRFGGGRASALLLGLFLMGAWVHPWGGRVLGTETSEITDSTVIGSTYGYLPGTPIGGLDLVVETAFYFKTLELFRLDGILGETFMGYRSPIRWRYRSREDLTLEAGVILGHDLGDPDRLNATYPLLRLVHSPSAKVFLIGGTLIPTHWIHDGILDDVHKLRTGVEQGFQARVDREVFRHDTWVNWRVREGRVRAEEFEIGSASRWSPAGPWLQMDGQFMWTHAGGQVSTSGRIEQNLIYLAGLSVGSGRRGPGLPPPGWRVRYHYLYSRDETDNSPLAEGKAHDLGLEIDLRPSPGMLLHLFGGRFRGDGLVSGRGDPLYGLEEYDQAGINCLFELAGGQMRIEAGFVHQWTEEVRNLTYQLAFTWGQAFALDWLHPRRPAPPGTAPTRPHRGP